MAIKLNYMITVTTSNAYLHLVPIFCQLYNRYWGDPFELVGYDKPEGLPDNCTFVSLGKQVGDAKNFTRDLRGYFAEKPQFFIWMMGDSFLKAPIDRNALSKILLYCNADTGRIFLTTEGMNREHMVKDDVYYCSPYSNYRLSTQPSIWNKDFLLMYMKNDLTPWEFEKQTTDDHYQIIGPVQNILSHNEGVRRFDIHKLNLEGIDL